MTHGNPPPLTPRIGFVAPTYGPVTGVMTWNSRTSAPSSAAAMPGRNAANATATTVAPAHAASDRAARTARLLKDDRRRRVPSAGVDVPAEQRASVGMRMPSLAVPNAAQAGHILADPQKEPRTARA